MLNASLETLFNRVAPNGLTEYQVVARVTEDDPSLATRNVQALLDFGDGSAVETPVTAGSVSINIPHAYSSGTFVITLTAQNFRAPTPDTLNLTKTVSIAGSGTTAATVPSPTYIAPIMPGGTGSSAPQSWNLNIGYDLDVLSSAVRLILATNAGEQLMNPSAGTTIKQLLFEQDPETVRGNIQKLLQTALSAQEPRVAVDSVSITTTGSDGRGLLVTVACHSLVSGLSFNVTETF